MRPTSFSLPWPGVTGDIPLSSCLDDAGEVFLAKYTGGKWQYLSRKDLGLPDPPATVQVRAAPPE